jgi:hypothetical protein
MWLDGGRRRHHDQKYVANFSFGQEVEYVHAGSTHCFETPAAAWSSYLAQATSIQS